MAKTLQDKIQKAKENAESTALTLHNKALIGEQTANVMMLIGGIKVANTIARSISAQALQALKQFGEGKGYEQFGFSRMDDFLDQCPQSPMTRNQYYDRLKLLESEGDVTFDLLNDLRIPMSARKALKKGEVAVEGNEVLVGEERIPLTETNRIKSVLKQVADKVTEQQRTIERGKDEIKKLKKERDEIRDAATPAPRATMDFDGAAGQAYLTILSAFAELETAIKQLPASRRREYLKDLQPGISLAIENFTLFANGLKPHGEQSDDDVLNAAIAAAAGDDDDDD